MANNNSYSKNMSHFSISSEIEKMKKSKNRKEDLKWLEEKINKRVGETLKYFRTLKGLYQGELGSMIGITYQQLSKYEKGENKMNFSKLIIACHFMGVSIEEFIETLNMKENKTLNYSKKINKYLNLNSSNRQIIDKIIDIL